MVEICTFSLSLCIIPIYTTRNLEFRSRYTFKGKRLINHVINATDAIDERFCRILCHSDYNCISYNFLSRGEAGRQRCELNDMSHVEYDGDLESSPNYTYYGAQVRIPENLYIIII